MQLNSNHTIETQSFLCWLTKDLAIPCLHRPHECNHPLIHRLILRVLLQYPVPGSPPAVGRLCPHLSEYPCLFSIVLNTLPYLLEQKKFNLKFCLKDHRAGPHLCQHPDTSNAPASWSQNQAVAVTLPTTLRLLKSIVSFQATKEDPTGLFPT